jgi:hypothetical protein
MHSFRVGSLLSQGRFELIRPRVCGQRFWEAALDDDPSCYHRSRRQFVQTGRELGLKIALLLPILPLVRKPRDEQARGKRAEGGDEERVSERGLE